MRTHSRSGSLASARRSVLKGGARRRAWRVLPRRLLALFVTMALVATVLLAAGSGGHEPMRLARDALVAPRVPPPTRSAGVPGSEERPARATRGRHRPPPPTPTPIEWRRSRAIGRPEAGRLLRGVKLPHEGRLFFTWDPIRKRSPNRPWRRYGTDRLVRVLLRVARRHAAAHPRAPRISIGDLSRPRGGDFGRRYGIVGHASHQNGLDADVYYPRRDERERAPRQIGHVDRRLAQDLVDRFVAAGAERVFVGPATGLRGPPGVVQVVPNHDDHLHVRLPAPPR